MASTSPKVVALEVQDDDSTVISLRVARQWIYVEANPSDLNNVQIRKQYDTLVSAYRTQQHSNDRQEQDEASCAKQTAQDSGYGSGEEATTPEKTIDARIANEDGEELLQNWMLEALASTCEKVATQKIKKDKISLAKWYDAPIKFYNITANSKDAEHLAVEAREDLKATDYLRDHIMPHTSAPKYLQDLKIPWYAPEDIIVEEEREDLHASIHPTVLSVATDQVPQEIKDLETTTATEDDSSERSENNSESSVPERTRYFFKMAAHGDASAVKREIRILETLRKKDLYNKGIRAPHLAGLVQLPRRSGKDEANPKSELIGFMLTMIPPPAVPLQHYMDSSIAQEERAAYAAEAQNMVDVLHKHDIVWGDAKADNFLVDGAKQLWMIDFGGNYTPGWIDAELADTLEGDDMGTEKIVLGLEYPDDAVEDNDHESDEDYQDASENANKDTKRKRKRGNRDKSEGVSDAESVEAPASQRRRQ